MEDIHSFCQHNLPATHESTETSIYIHVETCTYVLFISRFYVNLYNSNNLKMYKNAVRKYYYVFGSVVEGDRPIVLSGIIHVSIHDVVCLFTIT